MSAKTFQVQYEKSNILGFRSSEASKILVNRCIFRMGALYVFNYTLQWEEYTHRTIIAIKSSRCSDPLELLVIYNHSTNMVEENMVSSAYYI
jgi:hypothetical protein